MFVTNSVEKSFTPCLIDRLSKFTFCNQVLNFGIMELSVNIAAVIHAVIIKLEALNICGKIGIENL